MIVLGPPLWIRMMNHELVLSFDPPAADAFCTGAGSAHTVSYFPASQSLPVRLEGLVPETPGWARQWRRPGTRINGPGLHLGDDRGLSSPWGRPRCAHSAAQESGRQRRADSAPRRRPHR